MGFLSPSYPSSSSSSSSAVDRTLAGKNSPARKREGTKEDGLVAWDPKRDHNPPSLFRLRGVDLCGDIMMRVRSKLVTKKWKALFFQGNGLPLSP